MKKPNSTTYAPRLMQPAYGEITEPQYSRVNIFTPVLNNNIPNMFRLGAMDDVAEFTEKIRRNRNLKPSTRKSSPRLGKNQPKSPTIYS